jgi:acyl carrier protein
MIRDTPNSQTTRFTGGIIMKRPDLSREELLDKVVAAIHVVTGISIGPDDYGTNLFQMGLDSLKAIQIVNQLEDDLDLMIDDVNLPKFTSIEAIAAFFENMRE